MQDRFFGILDHLEIKKLSAVILTHSDFDHYSGMAALLGRYSEGGRSVGCFIDAGIDGRHVAQLLSTMKRSRFDELQEKITSLTRKETMKYRSASSEAAAIVHKVNHVEVRLFFLSPTPELARENARSDIRTQRRSGRLKLINNSSLVIAVQASEREHCEQGFLAADAERDRIHQSLQRWQERVGEDCWEFSFVKIPHHGSPHSHSSSLPESRDAGVVGAAAVCTCGDRLGLPSKKVIEEYAHAGWQVLSTNGQHSGTRTDRAFTLASPDKATSSCSDVKLFISRRRVRSEVSSTA